MKTIIKYDTSIYPLSIIKTAIDDYSDLCKIELTLIDSKAVLCFYDCIYDCTITIKEFSNYLIDLIGAKNVN